MAIVFFQPDNYYEQWKKRLHAHDPSLDLRLFGEHGCHENIEMALVWRPPHDFFEHFPKLRLIQSLGMGVDHIFECESTPDTVPIARIIDHNMGEQMANYILYGALHYQGQFAKYQQQQTRSLWQQNKARLPSDYTVGILGYGELGKTVATCLLHNGFNVRAWSNSEKNIPHIEHFYGQDQLASFLSSTDILVCLLPLTAQTTGILNYNCFKTLPKGAFLINAARGKHLIEKDLLQALEEQHLSGALLDVFNEEPLPSNHPFWQHDRIIVTPHISAQTNPKTASQQIVENYHRLQNNQPLLNLIDKTKGY